MKNKLYKLADSTIGPSDYKVMISFLRSKKYLNSNTNLNKETDELSFKHREINELYKQIDQIANKLRRKETN